MVFVCSYTVFYHASQDNYVIYKHYIPRQCNKNMPHKQCALRGCTKATNVLPDDAIVRLSFDSEPSGY